MQIKWDYKKKFNLQAVAQLRFKSAAKFLLHHRTLSPHCAISCHRQPTEIELLHLALLWYML
jgi:hypothetical protein